MTPAKRIRQPIRGAIYLLLALGLGVGSLWTGAGVYLGGASAEARVVEVDTHEGQMGAQMCSPVLEYEHDGETLRYQSELSESGCPDEVGDTRTVYFYPSDPEDASFVSSRLLLWPGSALFAAGVLGLFALFAFHGRRPTVAELASAAPLSTIRGAGPGEVVRVRGEVIFDGEPIESPLGGRSCVGYGAKVERVFDDRGEVTVTVSQEHRAVAFGVRDATATAWIHEGTKVRVGLEPHLRGDTRDESPVPSVEALMQRRGASKEDADTAKKRYLFSECIIEPGIEVDACGVVVEPDGDGRVGDGEPAQRTLSAPPDGSVLVASPVDDEA